VSPCRAVLAACPHFAASYDAVSLLRNRHACTILASMLRQDVDIEYQVRATVHSYQIAFTCPN
jgi:hypothetical protein